MSQHIEELLPRLLEFRHEREWEQFHLPKELATAITIESSELLELFLWNERKNAATIKQDQYKMTRIKEEIADVLIYLLFLSNDLDINLSEAVLNKLEKNRQKYPIKEYRGRYKEP